MNNRYIAGNYVISKAGHDKGRLYIIIKSDDEYIYVSDGEYRTLDKLKAKNIKHVQLIKAIDYNIEEKLSKGERLTDLDVKMAIKRYSSTDVNLGGC